MSEVIKYDGKDPKVIAYKDLFVEVDLYRLELEYLMIKYTFLFGELELKSARLEMSVAKKIRYINYLKSCGEELTRAEAMAEKAKIEAALVDKEKEVEIKEKRNAEILKMQVPFPSLPKSSVESRESFKRIARELHPAINGKSSENPAFNEMFQEAFYAYCTDNYSDLTVFNLKMAVAIETGDYVETFECDDIDKAYKELSAQYEAMKRSPFNRYRDIIDDDAKIEEFGAKIASSIKSFDDSDRMATKLIEQLEAKLK